MKLRKRLKRVLTGKGVWEVRRTIWPYPDGWGVYNPTTHTILETGISQTQAQQICDRLNEE